MPKVQLCDCVKGEIRVNVSLFATALLGAGNTKYHEGGYNKMDIYTYIFDNFKNWLDQIV